LNQIKSPEGTRRIGPPFPIKSTQGFSNPSSKSILKRRTEGEEHRGGGLGKQRIHGHNTKAAHNLTQVKGYLYPRDRSDWYAGPVRPVGSTGQTGARDRSDRLACSTPCTRSHPTAEVLSSKRSLLRDAAVLMEIQSAVLKGPRNPGRWPVLRKPPKPHAREDSRLRAMALDAVLASAF